MFRARLFEGPSYQSLMTVLASRITYFLMIGLGLLLGGWFVLEDQYVRAAPSAFRKTACVIVDSGVAVHGRGRYGVPTSFVPVVTFTFKAEDGREYTASGYRLYEGGMSEGEAGEVADRYDPGQETYCYYDPADPAHAVLSLEADGRSLGLLVLFSVLLLFGGLAGWVILDFVVKPARPTPLASLDVAEVAPLLAAVPKAPSDALRVVPGASARQEGYQGRV